MHCNTHVLSFSCVTKYIQCICSQLKKHWQCNNLQSQVKKDDSVIIMTHEPTWLLDWYWGSCTGKNVSHLIQDHLQGRCRLRLAGDLHHYMRHSAIQSETSNHAEHLIVNGSGGAFLHPTHVFEDFHSFQGTHYKRESAYPTIEESRKVCHKIVHKLISNFAVLLSLFGKQSNFLANILV